MSGALAPVVGARRIIDLYYSVHRLLPDLPGGYVGDNFDIARLYGLEDAWREADSGHQAIGAEVLEECTRIASEQRS